MFQSLVLPAEAVSDLRNALSLPQFSAILEFCPSLQLALEHPQPNLSPHLRDVSDAISQVKRDTCYPEYWNELEEAINDAHAASIAFHNAHEKVRSRKGGCE